MNRTATFAAALALAALASCGHPQGPSPFDETRQRAQAAATPTTSTAPQSPTVTSPALPPGESFRVYSVTDGDTVKVVPASTAQGATKPSTTIRIIGINTPETFGPKAGECKGYGKTSTQLAKDVLLNKTVILSKDPTQASTDRFNRELRFVDVQGLPALPAPFGPTTDYSSYAAYQGTAFPFVYDNVPSARADVIQLAADDAKTANRGVWAICPGNAPHS
jgi:endonuclease YncB( thermonuclease family)